MRPESVVGAALAAGFLIFLVGAVAWRRAYQQPLIDALPVIHSDRRRRAWIHLWMGMGTFVTPAGLAGLILIPAMDGGQAVAAMAFAVYLMAAMCWLIALGFRLTVVPWAAGRTVTDGTVPEQFPALDAWAGVLYTLFMTASYVAFIILGMAVISSSELPRWLGWLGVGSGGGLLLGFTITRFEGPFNPPILVHTYTALVGIVLLTL